MNEQVQALFALTRTYPLNDKSALAEVAEFGLALREFGQRLQHALGHLGGSPAVSRNSPATASTEAPSSAGLTDGLYRPRYPLPM